MPYKSDRQRRYFYYLKSKGKLPKSINLKEWDEKGIEGKGLKDFLLNALAYIKGIRSRFSKEGRDLLERNGTQIIKEIYVFRQPLQGAVKFLLNLLTNSGFERQRKRLNYDDIFHVGLVLKLQNGTEVKLEKLHVPNLTKNLGLTKQTQLKKVPLNTSISLNEFISNAVNLIKGDYWKYNTLLNCQHFVLSHLKSNGLLSNDLYNYIYQNPKELLKNLPGLSRTILDALLEEVSRGDVLIRGGNLEKMKTKLIKNVLKKYIPKYKNVRPQTPRSSKRNKTIGSSSSRKC